MTKDTYLKLVEKTLSTDPMIRIHASQQSKLAALGRLVERREKTPLETVDDIVLIFDPFINRSLRQNLERALR
ncbi:MAG: hypothetical protein E6P95_01345 [Candidatus Moraniibacteriota bacterium]|nr:MAG: hypothetical protein E6P95_01345 [Candidatus Moranbacteria bacterium]